MSKEKTIAPRQQGQKVVFYCRLSYAHLDEPYGREGEKKKYQVNAIIDKGDTATVEAVKAAINAAIEAGVSSKWKGVRPKKLDVAFYDGDTDRDDAAYAGAWYFNAKSEKPVAVLNRMKEVIPATEAYSGCWALMSVTFFPYEASGKKGVGAGLNSVLKMYDGEPLGGTGDGKRDFDEFDLGVVEDTGQAWGLDDM